MKDQSVRGARRLLFALAVTLCVGGAAGPDARAQDRVGDERMPIAGGTAALLEQCRLPPVEPARAMLVLARAVHAATPVTTVPEILPVVAVSALDAARAKGLPGEDVPALLPLSIWQRHVFGRAVSVENLASAIIADKQAALLYYGLFSLDDETLTFLVAHPSILNSIDRYHAAVFADFAESITVRNGAVVLPGDEGARPIWENLVGAVATDPERFIPQLLGRDEGRLAWMFDTIAHLDSPHQDFALGRHLAGAQRADYMKGVYAVFADFQRRAFVLPLRPFVHPRVDPAFVLATVAVTDDGRLAAPAAMATWAGPFGGTGAGGAGEVTAPWLLQNIFTLSGRSRLDIMLFAQRLVAAALRRGVRIDDSALPPVLSAFSAHQGLMLALERLGFVEPRDYVQAVETASALPPGTAMLPASLRAAMFQGALALLVRMHEVDTLDDKTAQGLARMLIALPAADAARYSDYLLQWIEHALIPAVAGGRDVASMDAEGLLLDGLSGAVAGRPTPVVEWEEQSYRVDLAAAESARLRKMLEKQQAYSLNLALDLRRLAVALPDPSAAGKLADLLSQVDLLGGGTLFGASVPSRRDGLLSDLRQLQRNTGDASRTSAVRRRVGEVLDVLLADVLAAYVYAIAIEEPDSPLLLVDRPARAHDFDLREPAQVGAWKSPVNLRLQAMSTSVIRGSLLGLERAVAVFSLRRTTLQSPAVAPAVGQQDVQGLAESAVALNSFHLTDAGRDAIAAALRQGRDRVAAVARDPAAADALVAEVSVERWRRRMIRWAAARDPGAVVRYLSLGEILMLGSRGTLPPEAQGWGVARRLVDGSFDVALPTCLAWHRMSGRLGIGLLAAQVADLPLHVAESLATLKMPAALAHGVLQYATWDMIQNVRMADIDDWLAVVNAVQALTADQMADYVSALTADGPLVPIKQ